MTSAPAERRARKGLGAFYSPPELVEPLIAWAIRSPADAVLDPSCGDGVFLTAAARRLEALGAPPGRLGGQLHGLDVSGAAARATAAALAALGLSPPATIARRDFFAVEPPPAGGGGVRVDAVVGNPPYIRYQAFRGEARARALRRAHTAGVTLSRLASSWAPFVIHATSFLRPGGRMAFILPAELIHAGYASGVRTFLRRRFADVSVLTFRRARFEGAEEEVLWLLADGLDARARGALHLAELPRPEASVAIDHVLACAEHVSPDVEPVKWRAGWGGRFAAAALDALVAQGALVPLSACGKAGIGFVSGANEYFVVTEAEATRLDLPAASLRRAVIRARHVAGLVLHDVDHEALRAGGERCLLFQPGARPTAAERRYLALGERRGVSRRYKCQHRAPWFAVPGAFAPDAFLLYMSDAWPRLCRNAARAAPANTLLAVTLGGVPRALHAAFTVSFYNSATLLSCELTGRSYGGGVLKLEPREADRVLVPSPESLNPLRRRLEALAGPLDAALRCGDAPGIEALVAAIDGHVLPIGALARGELAARRAELVARRRGRRASTRSA